MPFGGFNLGGKSEKTSSQSQSSSFGLDYNQSQSYLDPQQQFNQQQLINRYFNQMPQMGATPGMDFQRQNVLGRLAGLGSTAMSAGNAAAWNAKQGLGQLGQFARQGNPYLQQQIAGLAQDAGQFYQEQLLPGIGSNAQLAGQRGSSRQGIAEALAGQRVGQEFLQAAAGLRSNAYGQQQQAAAQYAGLGQQAAQGYYGIAGSARGQQGQLANQFAGTGLQAQMTPFMIGSEVIGAPSILNSQFGFGFDTSQSTSTSKGKSAGLDIGLKPG